MAKRRGNWDWPRISGWFVLLFAPARADARFARTKGDYVRMLLQCLLGIAALLLPRILHALSGAMLGALGFSVLTFLNKTEGIPVSMSPAFVALFTLCFALTLDVLFQTNMQKYALEGGEALTGQAALQDTMGDLIVDFIGALGIAIAGYLSRTRGKGNLVHGLILKRRSPEGEQEHKAGAPQEEGAGKLPAPSSCFALSAPASCARAPR